VMFTALLCLSTWGRRIQTVISMAVSMMRNATACVFSED
jgi:hypothetical protein